MRVAGFSTLLLPEDIVIVPSFVSAAAAAVAIVPPAHASVPDASIRLLAPSVSVWLVIESVCVPAPASVPSVRLLTDAFTLSVTV